MGKVGEVTHPIEGQVVLLAGAQASVPLSDLSALVERTQKHLAGRREIYERRFERIDGPGDAVFYLAEDGCWATVGKELGFSDRETDAVRRSHESQFRRAGRRLDRTDEFETALEIRDVVAIAPPAERSR